MDSIATTYYDGRYISQVYKLQRCMARLQQSGGSLEKCYNDHTRVLLISYKSRSVHIKTDCTANELKLVFYISSLIEIVHHFAFS